MMKIDRMIMQIARLAFVKFVGRGARPVAFLGLLCFVEMTLILQIQIGRVPIDIDGLVEISTVDDYENSFLVIDVVSISSLTRPELPAAQAATWGSHRSVRYFRVVTEADDADPYCADKMLLDDVRHHSNVCRWRHQSHKFLRRHIFGRWQWLFKKASPTGWLCAQKRPANGLGKMGDFYRSRLEVGQKDDTDDNFPDYLVLVDDDTYFNLELFHAEMNGLDPSDPVVYAGCLVRDGYNNTIMFGGFGTIFSRGSISRLVRPIHCNSSVAMSSTTKTSRDVSDEEFQARVCARFSENLFGEGVIHRPGMSISDLMRSFANRPNAPYCHHSDWALADFVNYYYLSNRARYDVPGDGRDYMRLHPYVNSELKTKSVTGNCLNQHEERCRSETSHACHYMSAERMNALTDEVKASLSSVTSGASGGNKFKDGPSKIVATRLEGNRTEYTNMANGNHG